MAQELPKVMGVEFNHEVECLINTTPTEETPTYASMCNAFKNIAVALNEVVYSAAYLSDGGFSSSAVVGFAPTVTLQGDFMAADPACAYLDKIQWKLGKDRVTDIKMTRNGQTITCPVTFTSIAIAGGESTAPNSITVTIALNGKPAITAASAADPGSETV